MIVNLRNNSEDVLHLAQLPPDQLQTVKAYVVNYENPGDSCSDKIAWAAYRIWNAIKAIFGMSDWQKATAIVKNRVYEAANIALLDGGEPKPPYYEFIESKAEQFASKILIDTLDLHNSYLEEDDVGFVPDLDDNETLDDVVAQIREKAQAAAPALHRAAADPVVDATPEFDFYNIAKGTDYEGSTLSGMSLRPANLFFRALGAATTMPGSGSLFRFLDSANKVRNDIERVDPNAVVQFSAKGVPGRTIIAGIDTLVPDLANIYGSNTYRISYKEIQDTLASQRIYCSPMLPELFYHHLKLALLFDGEVVLPGSDRAPIRMGDLATPGCKALIEAARINPGAYGFPDGNALETFLELSIYQVGAMVVKTEDYRIFTDGNGQIRERNPGEQDAIRLINACGIRGIRATPGPINAKIMEKTFKTALEAAEDGIVVFPAVGMGVWKGDPEIYWNAFLKAVANGNKDIETIYVNPRHQKSIDGQYRGRDGDEFAEILARHIAEAENADAAKNLNKIVNLYDKKTDLLQLAHNLKKANPDKTVSIFNASDPDVTLGNHVTEYMNNRPHGASTTEEHYSMMGTNGLCFETITGIHEDLERIIQVE